MKILMAFILVVILAGCVTTVPQPEYTLTRFNPMTLAQAQADSTYDLCIQYHNASLSAQQGDLIVTQEQKVRYQAAVDAVNNSGYETAQQLLKTLTTVLPTRFTSQEWAAAQAGSPQIGDSEAVVYCELGYPDHENTDALGPDQLVYDYLGIYVYIKDGKVVDVQTNN